MVLICGKCGGRGHTDGECDGGLIIEQLQAEVEGLRADAARWDWIRRHPGDVRVFLLHAKAYDALDEAEVCALLAALNTAIERQEAGDE